MTTTISIAKATEEIDALNSELDDVFRAAYKAGVSAVRDCVRNMTWRNQWEELISEEFANEKQHEKFRPSGVKRSRFPHKKAALLLLLQNVADGADENQIDPSGIFTLRQSAFKAMVLGWLIREHLPADWKTRARALDYCALKEA